MISTACLVTVATERIPHILMVYRHLFIDRFKSHTSVLLSSYTSRTIIYVRYWKCHFSFMFSPFQSEKLWFFQFQYILNLIMFDDTLLLKRVSWKANSYHRKISYAFMLLRSGFFLLDIFLI